MTEPEPIPLIIRTRLAHATLQAIADECGADILHIKGPAVATFLVEPEDPGEGATTSARHGTDADVLVRPTHLNEFLRNVEEWGWDPKTHFDRSAPDHAAVYWHDELSWADIHRKFPGFTVSPRIAFEQLWEGRYTVDIAHRQCNVPARDAQILVLLLHAARGRGEAQDEIQQLWGAAGESQRNRVQLLAATFGAAVALAAVSGHLEQFADSPERELWTLLSRSGSPRPAVWFARLKAAQTTCERINLLLRPFRSPADSLAMQMWRRPTKLEISKARAVRFGNGAWEFYKFFRRKLSNDRDFQSRK